MYELTLLSFCILKAATRSVVSMNTLQDLVWTEIRKETQCSKKSVQQEVSRLVALGLLSDDMSGTDGSQLIFISGSGELLLGESRVLALLRG